MRCFLAVKPQIFKNFTLEQEIGGVAGVAQEILMRTVITAVYLRLKFCGAKLLYLIGYDYPRWEGEWKTAKRAETRGGAPPLNFI